MLARTNLNQGKLQRDVMKVQRSRMASRTLIKRINSGSNHLCGQVFYSKVIKQKDIIFLPSLKKALNKTPRSVARNTKHVTLPLVLDTPGTPKKFQAATFLAVTELTIVPNSGPCNCNMKQIWDGTFEYGLPNFFFSMVWQKH